MPYSKFLREILIVEDHPSMQEVLEAIVHKAFNGITVHVHDTLEDALAAAADMEELGLALLDLRLPGHSGISALTAFRRRLPRLRFAVVAASDDRNTIVSCLKAGAAGYIPKTSPQRVIVAALRLISVGGIYLPPQCIGYLDAGEEEQASQENAPASRLTQRQRQVLRLLLEGRSNSQVAEELDISEGTVKQHAHAIYEAIGVSSRAQLFAQAARGGIRQDGSPITKDV